VFRENEGRISQFRNTDEITKETTFAKEENRENGENLMKKKYITIFLLILVKGGCVTSVIASGL
jgi:hypothetical protein